METAANIEPDPIKKLYIDGKRHDVNVKEFSERLKGYISMEDAPDIGDLAESCEWAGKVLEVVTRQLESQEEVSLSACRMIVDTEHIARDIAKKHFNYDKVCEDYNEGGFPGDGYWQEPDTDFLLELFEKKLNELTGK